MTAARIRAIQDPKKRVVRAQKELTAALAKAAEIQNVRDDTIWALLADDTRPSEVARLIGVTNAAISNRFKRP